MRDKGCQYVVVCDEAGRLSLLPVRDVLPSSRNLLLTVSHRDEMLSAPKIWCTNHSEQGTYTCRSCRKCMHELVAPAFLCTTYTRPAKQYRLMVVLPSGLH